MSAFTIGLIVGGFIGVPFAVWLAGKRRKREERDVSEKSSV